jgi:tetratricopeptide (TPR) repeat protein
MPVTPPKNDVRPARHEGDQGNVNPPRRPLLVPACLVAGLSLLAYLPVLGHDFVEWDDRTAIVSNPRLNPPTGEGLTRYWTELRPHKEFYAPVMQTVFWLVAHVAGQYSSAQGAVVLRPLPYHAINWVVHAANGVLVLIVLHRLVRNRWAACVGAMLFVLHPIQAESVAWASTMYSPLSAMFSFVAFWQYLRFSDLRCEAADPTPPQTATRFQRSLPFAAATLAYLVAVLTKPTMVVVPFMVGAIEVFLRGRRLRNLLPLVTWVLIAAPIILLARASQRDAPVYVPPAPWRVLVALDSLAFYIGKIFLPVGLAADYGRSPRWLLDESGQAYLTWLMPVFLLAIAWGLRRKAPWVLACVALFVAALLTSLGFVPFDYQRYSTVADRYVYPAMLAPALALAWVLARQPRRTALAVAAGVTLLLGAYSSYQTLHWRDTETLFQHTLAINPRSLAAHGYYGYQHAQAGRFDLALASYDKALRANPGDPVVLSLVGGVYMRQRRLPEAIAAYRDAVTSMPNSAQHNINLGVALAQTGQVDEGLRYLRQAIELEPDNAEAHANLATALSAREDWAGARRHYEDALKFDPKSVTARRGIERLQATGH